MCVNWLESDPKAYMLAWNKGKRANKPRKNRYKFKIGDHVRYWIGPEKDAGFTYKRYDGLSEVRSKHYGRVSGQKKRANWSDYVFQVLNVMTRYGKQYCQLDRNPEKVQKKMDMTKKSASEIARWVKLEKARALRQEKAEKARLLREAKKEKARLLRIKKGLKPLKVKPKKPKKKTTKNKKLKYVPADMLQLVRPTDKKSMALIHSRL